MADNTTLNAGSGGDIISTDDIGGGVKVQRVKVQHGADGSATDVSTASPLPVGDAGGSLTVDGTVAVSSLPAIPAGTNNIGDVDVLTLPALAAGSALIGGVNIRDGAGDSCMDDSLNALRVTQVAAAGTALADDTANPTAPFVGVFPHVFDGSTWDRLRGNSAGGMFAQGPAAHDAPNTGNPVLLGGYADEGTPANVSAPGDVARIWVSGKGAQYVTMRDDSGDSAMDNANNSLRVSIVSGAGSGGTSMTDDAAFTVGTSGVTPAAGVYTSGRDTVNDGDAGAFAMTQQRALIATLETPAGDAVINDTTNAMQVHVVATDIPLGGTSMTDDAGFTPGTTAVTPVAGIYRSTRDLVDDGDAGALAMNQRRGLFVTLETSSGTALGTDASALPTRLVDGSGDSCMDNVNDALRVNVVAGGAAGGGISQADDSAFAPGTTPLTPVGGLYLGTRDTVDDSDTGAFAMTQKRAILSALETPSGDTAMDDVNDAVRCNIVAGGFSTPPSDTNTTDAITAVDDAVTLAANFQSRGSISVEIRETWVATLEFEATYDGVVWFAFPMWTPNGAGPVTSTTANGRWIAPVGGVSQFRVRASAYTSGSATVNLRASMGAFVHAVAPTRLVTPNGDSAMDETNDAVKIVPVSGSTVAAIASGVAAHDSPVSGNPVRIGAKASAATPGSVSADGDTVDLWADGNGRLHVKPYTTTSEPVFARIVDGVGDSVSDDANNAIRVNVVAGGAGGGDVQGVDAHDAALTADPLTIGGYASAAQPTAVSADGDAVRAWFYPRGQQVVSLVDSVGTQLIRVEDSGAVNGHVGIPPLAVRRDTATSAVDTDGDYAMLGVSSAGRLWTSATIDAALPAGTNNIGDVDVLSVIPGTGATALGKAEDAAAGDGDTGVAMLAVRRDSASSGVGADGDYAMLSVDSTGALRVTGGDGSVQGVDAHDAAITGDPVLLGARASAAAPTNVSADDDAVRLWALRNGALATQITAAGALVGGDATNGLDVDVTRLPGTIGAVAHDAAASGCNPVLAGFEARTSEPTAVANGDLVRPMASVLGKLVTHVGALPGSQANGNLNRTTNSAGDVIAAAGAGIKIAVMSITVINKHASVDTTVTIRDGTTAKYGPFIAKANGSGFSPNGGGFPLFVGSANTAITAICGTTGSDVDIFVSGYLTTE